MKVGDIYKTKYWGDVEILEVKGWGQRCLYKFLLTGNIRDSRKTEVTKGNVRDSESMANGGQMIEYLSPQRVAAQLSEGDVFPTNFWGNVFVTEYRCSTEIDVQFVNSGNKYTVQLDALRKGLVKDSKLCNLQNKIKRDAERAVRKAEADTLKEISRYNAMIVRINKVIQSAHARHKRDCERQNKLDKILQSKVDTIYDHPVLGKYNISRILTSSTCEVTFHRTNYTQVLGIGQAEAGWVRDLSQFATEELYTSAKAANHYQQNREYRLEQAKQYQKDNLDKARVRNRNRRARRISAEGTHTLEETDALLVEQQGRCNCCGVELDDTKHLDHIMPLCLGGSNWIENLQWLCVWCNSNKSGKHPDVWKAEIQTLDWQRRRATAASYVA